VTYVVFGVVNEQTSAGLRPIPDARVEASACGPSRIWATTGGDGLYTLTGICGGAGWLAVTKDGYDRARVAGDSVCVSDGTEYPECRDLFISGDTRADVLLVRR